MEKWCNFDTCKICLLRKVTNHAKVPSGDVTQCRVYDKTVTGIQVHQHQQQQWLD